MNKKIVVGLARLLVISLCWSVPVSRAQEQSAAETKAPTSESSIDAYRLDFVVSEMEDGKKINSRQYSMNLNANDGNGLKIGTRIPVEAEQGKFQYVDVGTNLRARLKDHANGMELQVGAEISNFAVPEATRTCGVNTPPLIRQMQINASTLAVIGKPMVVGSVDDPNSKRQFQLEVTVTRLK